MTPPVHLLGSPAITENLLKRKWSVTILRYLKKGTYDPVEIIRLEDELSPLAMNERLRTMLRYCLIDRHPRFGRPKVVEYRLTPKGRRILTMLELISRLDQYDDHDPRSLEEILRADLMVGPAPLVILPEPKPKAALRPKNPERTKRKILTA